MNFEQRAKATDSGLDVEMELGEVLGNFRSSVHAWSDAEFARPRAMAFAMRRRGWRRATAWALGCVLAAGSLSAGIYEREHSERLARIAAAHRAAERAAQQQLAARQAAEKTRAQDEQLMAAVDRDVSQEVPSAMEPLADLMDDGGN